METISFHSVFRPTLYEKNKMHDKEGIKKISIKQLNTGKRKKTKPEYRRLNISVITINVNYLKYIFKSEAI